MPSVGFETVIPTSERPQTQFLDRAAAGRDTDEVFTFFYHPPLLFEIYNKREIKAVNTTSEDFSKIPT